MKRIVPGQILRRFGGAAKKQERYRLHRRLYKQGTALCSEHPERGIMRRLLTFMVVLLALKVCGPECSAENPVPEHNPDYRTRAGTFYEKKYLPGATKRLICVFAPQELSEKKARQILHQFIYNFLDQYIADGGATTRRNHARILARLDSRVQQLADGPSILKNYEAWKSGSSGKFPNPLAFLTQVVY